MRTLALGLLAIASVTLTLLSYGAPVAAEPTDKEKTEMAAKVYTLLKDKCYSCHGEAGKKVMGKKGTLNYILDYDKLVSEKLIDTASPEKSKLYTEISEGEMPRELDKDGKAKIKKKLAQADIDLVLNWIKAGAPKWEVASSDVVALVGHREKVVAVTFSPDGKLVLTGCQDKTARLWNSTTGKETLKLDHPEPVSGATFSPDGKFVFTTSQDSMIRVWDVSSGKEVRSFRAVGARYCSIAISPDGKLLLCERRLWNSETGEEVRALEGHEGGVTSGAFSPDGKQVLTGGRDKTVRLWETDSGKELRKFDGHTEAVWSAVFSPDGKFVLSGSDDKTARLWDAATGKEIRKIEGKERFWTVAFSADGKYVVTSGDYSARVWDVETGKELNSFKHNFKEDVQITAQTTGAAFSPDGKRVVSCDVGGFVRIWVALTEKK